jgi:hypothetical protein
MAHNAYAEDIVLVIAGIKVTVGLIVMVHGIAKIRVQLQEMLVATNMIIARQL